eukprot:CAMPEP_0181298954 /NCGR_PEP_ID=MMETSP1101-20121128/6068_1 /TAXON_ID=46948 /ORGANISM="Rhodomonas abbreviata, Strain Caron Lab Isolate" /LENGTH=201 /DNA_ID=CAMNT_0023404031 /DNA_START=12 /DNA_END=617 /DNA_ORIENTATION=-
MSAELENKMLKDELSELEGAAKAEERWIFQDIGDALNNIINPVEADEMKNYKNIVPPAEEYLSVAVVEARNVPAEDLVGANAHFCRIKSGKVMFNTGHQQWTLNPQFDHVFLIPLGGNNDLVVELYETPLLGGAEKRVGWVEFNLVRLLQDVKKEPVSGLQSLRTKNAAGETVVLQGTAPEKPCQLMLSFEFVRNVHDDRV